jgi:4-hydroxybenzoate polyprenyltransferase
MVSPNWFLRLNISFSIILFFILMYDSLRYKNKNIFKQIISIMFLYIAINNIYVINQKSNPNLKKNIFRINTFLYLLLLGIIVLNYNNNKNNSFLLIGITFFGLFINYCGFIITKIN